MPLKKEKERKNEKAEAGTAAVKGVKSWEWSKTKKERGQRVITSYYIDPRAVKVLAFKMLL